MEDTFVREPLNIDGTSTTIVGDRFSKRAKLGKIQSMHSTEIGGDGSPISLN